FRTQLKNAYLDASIVSSSGAPEKALTVDRSLSFDGWLDALAGWILGRTYPSFERFAPTYGPLPKEAYRSLMRFVSEKDLGDADADDHVKLIREAYLVPMRLMGRKGRDYVLPRNPEKNELVRLVLPMLEYDAVGSGSREPRGSPPPGG
ncbi:MAG: hypothetical protein O7J95_14745, partial [Planctomycetota bacterium]|nr:hypothetical protein [Planctomycetota bacterium]